jgi:hypothetical protein
MITKIHVAEKKDVRISKGGNGRRWNSKTQDLKRGNEYCLVKYLSIG